MLPLPHGVARSERNHQNANRVHIVDNQRKPELRIRPRNLVNSTPPAVTAAWARNKKHRGENSVPIPQSSQKPTFIADDNHRRRAGTLPGTAQFRRISVDLLIRHFESLDRHDKNLPLHSRQRALTAPADNLRDRYHSALSQRRTSRPRPSSAAAIREDRFVEDNPSFAQPTRDTGLTQQKTPSLIMWPFVDRRGNLKIEPLAPIEDEPHQNDEGIRRKSTPEAEEQEDQMTALRPSKSLSSLKLTPQRRGLQIAPGAAVSQSSVVFAQGVVSSARPKSEGTHDHPMTERMAQTQGEAPESEPESGFSNHAEGTPTHKEETGTVASDPDPDLGSSKDGQDVHPEANPTGKDEEGRRSPGNEKSPGVDSTPINESNDPQEPVSSPAIDSAQSSEPGTVLDRDNEALMDLLSNAGAVKPERRHTWLDISTNGSENPEHPQKARSSSMTCPIPTIRVQPTTESEDNGSPSVLLAEKHAENSPGVVESPVPGTAADQGQTSSAGLSNVPSQNSTSKVSHSAEIGHENSRVESGSLLAPATDKTNGTADTDHPGFAKLAIRKARNAAGSKFVLSILLGRQLAEQTKPQLQELARPSIRRQGKRGVGPGPCQVDGIAELE